MHVVTGRGQSAPKAKSMKGRKVSGLRIRRPSNGTGLAVTAEYEPEKRKGGRMMEWSPGMNESENFFDDHGKAMKHVAGVMRDIMGLSPAEEEKAEGEAA